MFLVCQWPATSSPHKDKHLPQTYLILHVSEVMVSLENYNLSSLSPPPSLIQAISSFSVAQAREVIRSPLSSPIHKSSSPPNSSDEIDEFGVTEILVEECYTNHKRASFGVLPPGQCRLCSYCNGRSVQGVAHGPTHSTLCLSSES